MKRWNCFYVLFSLLIVRPAMAQLPQTMSYQGRLTDAAGIVVPNGSYSLTFKLYDVSSAGAALWTESNPSVQVTNGVFSVTLGNVTAFGLPFDRQYWLGLSVSGGAELSPRTQLTSSPYSMKALGVSGSSNVFPSSGNVGIGTTSPTELLQLGSFSASDRYLTLKSAGGNLYRNGIKFRHFNETIGFTIENDERGGSLGLNILRHSNDSAGVTSLFIDKLNGNVGIGTTSPAAKLTVNSGASASTLELQSTSAGGNVELVFENKRPGGGTADVGKLYSLNTADNFDGGQLRIAMLGGLGFYSDVATFTGTGNVGIGTTSPGLISGATKYLSVINQSGYAPGSVTSLELAGNVNSGSAPVAKIDFLNAGANNTARIEATTTTGSTAQGRLLFYTNGGSLTEKMRISETGNVGIGTTSPSTAASLHVAGNNIAVDGTTSQGIVWVNGNTYQAHIHRYGAVNGNLYVTNNGLGNLTGVYLTSGGTSWTTTSDRRLKENIKDATYGLDAVLQIPVREFNFKHSQEKGKKIGFIAQEIYPIIPEIVQKGDEGEYSGQATASASATDASSFIPWGVDYSGLTPILVKSIQEQQRVIETLSKRLDEERTRYEGLESRLQALEKKLNAGQ